VSEILTLNNIGLKGINTDHQPWELSPEFITYGKNFRVFAGALSAAGGYQLWENPASAYFPGHAIHVGRTSGEFWLVPGRHAVQVFHNDLWNDIGGGLYPSMGDNDELKWTSCMLGQIPVINNPQDSVQYWAPQQIGTDLKDLPFDATDIDPQNHTYWRGLGFTFEVIRSHRNYLFALNLSGETVEPEVDSYRWSHPADSNNIPVTWDETNPQYLAGKAALGGDGGHIIDGHSLRDSFVIYSESAINILDFSNDEFVWNRRELSSTVGLLSRNCIVEVKGQHIFLADGDIVTNDGTNIESIAHNRIRRQLNARINVDKYRRSFAVRNNALKEAWFCVVEDDAEYPNVAYIYNWRDNSWVVRDLPYDDNKQVPPTIYQGVGYAAYGSQSEPIRTWDDYVDSDTWDSQKGVWGSAELTPLDDTVVGVDPINHRLYILDPFGTPEDDISTRLERTDFPLLDQREVTTITRVYPHIQGTQELSIQFGSQDHAGSPVRWKPAVLFNPATDRKIDVRSTGELHCWRFDSVGKNTWTMSGMDIEFERSGKR